MTSSTAREQFYELKGRLDMCEAILRVLVYERKLGRDVADAFLDIMGETIEDVKIELPEGHRQFIKAHLRGARESADVIFPSSLSGISSR